MRHSFRGAIACGLYSCCRSGFGLAFVTTGPLSSTAAIVKGTRRSASDGEVRGEMAATGDARHHPSALRNRDFISAELVKWVGQGQEHGDGDGAGHMLEIASGTGEFLVDKTHVFCPHSQYVRVSPSRYTTTTAFR